MIMIIIMRLRPGPVQPQGPENLGREDGEGAQPSTLYYITLCYRTNDKMVRFDRPLFPIPTFPTSLFEGSLRLSQRDS